MRVRQLTFITGAALAGFAGAVLGPIQGVDPNFGTTLVATGFLAVLLSGRTLIGLRPRVRRARHRPDDLLALRERGLGERRRDRDGRRDPAVPPAGARAQADDVSKTRGLWVAGAVALVVLVLLMPHLLGTYYLSLLTESLLFGVAALSLDLVWGYTGIPDLGHALWFGTGALAVGMMTTKLDPTGLVLGNVRRARAARRRDRDRHGASRARSRSSSGCCRSRRASRTRSTSRSSRSR